jgi:NAD(P)-dependent dehydrogenase (short-subunit alcohol dehydrogenase family)
MANNQKTALVTGSSRGIGRAIALRLAQDGYFVYVHCVGSLTKAQEVKDEIIAAGGKADILSVDLCDIDAVKAMGRKLGNIDVLVLNASVQIRQKWSEITTEEAYTQLNCNLVASMHLIQAFAPHMQAQKWGRIVTIGSVQEAKPHPDMLVYSASKAAQTNMVRSLSLQLAKDGITVNNVAPGVIYTDRNVEALSDPEYAKKVTDSIPVGFYGQPQDCAGIVSLLCSEDGRYITGQNIFVDGGKSL